MEIIFKINAHFLVEVLTRWPGDKDRVARMSLIEEAVNSTLEWLIWP